MTRLQSLVKIEIPIALPVIMAGIRMASVLVIGTATLSTPVGQTSLGNYIFTGLQTQNWVDVLVGCVAAALLALMADRLLGGLEALATRRGARTRVISAAAAIMLVLCAGAFAASFRPASGYVIGAKGFPEQYVLASLIEQRLAASGIPASVKSDLGSAVIFSALTAGDVDVYVDYSGTIWTNFMHRTDSPPREAMLKAIGAWVMCSQCARIVRRRSASGRCPILRGLQNTSGWAAIMKSSAVRSGKPCAGFTASISVKSARCSRSSCIKPSRTAMSMRSPHFPAMAESPNTAS
jgi:hypothetical protein